MGLIYLDIVLFSIWLAVFGWYKFFLWKSQDKKQRFPGSPMFFIIFMSSFYHGVWFLIALILIWRFSLEILTAIILAAPGMFVIALLFLKWWLKHYLDVNWPIWGK